MKLSELAATKWTGNNVRIATAVALAESRGKMDAEHKNADGSTDYGPWQVNSIHGYDGALLKSDPAYTVNAAYEVWKSSGWNAWVTYKTGAYLPFMAGDAELTADDPSILSKIAGSVLIGPIPRALGVDLGDVPNPVNALGSGLDVLNALTDPSTWLRVGKGALGGAVIIMGVGALVFVVANKASSSPIANAVPTGRALNAVKAIKTGA